MPTMFPVCFENLNQATSNAELHSVSAVMRTELHTLLESGLTIGEIGKL